MPIKRMATKGKGVASSSARPTSTSKETLERRELLDSTTNLDDDAIDFYEGQSFTEDYCYVIRKLEWETFTSKAPDINEHLVRDFYARLPESGDGVMQWGGKQLIFKPKPINDVYNLPTLAPSEDTYAIWKADKRETWRMMLDILTQGRKALKVSKSKSATWSNFSIEAKVWRRWLAHRVFGVSKNVEITRDQYTLLFCILDLKKVDIGKVIHTKLEKFKTRLATLKEVRKLTLPFPNLISGLCKAAQIPNPPGSFLRSLSHTFTWKTIKDTNEPQDSENDINTYVYISKVWTDRAFDDETAKSQIGGPTVPPQPNQAGSSQVPNEKEGQDQEMHEAHGEQQTRTKIPTYSSAPPTQFPHSMPNFMPQPTGLWNEFFVHQAWVNYEQQYGKRDPGLSQDVYDEIGRISGAYEERQWNHFRDLTNFFKNTKKKGGPMTTWI